MKRWAAGGIILSSVATEYIMVFQACSLIVHGPIDPRLGRDFRMRIQQRFFTEYDYLLDENRENVLLTDQRRGGDDPPAPAHAVGTAAIGCWPTR